MKQHYLQWVNKTALDQTVRKQNDLHQATWFTTVQCVRLCAQ